MLTINCAVSDQSQLMLWPQLAAEQQPDGSYPPAGGGQLGSWPPRALRVDCWPDEERVAVVEGECGAQLLGQAQGGF